MKLKSYFKVEENVFTAKECDDIIQFAESGLYSKEDRQAAFRDSDVIFFPHDDDSNWIYERLYTAIDDVKKKTWRTFKIYNLQSLQYTIYRPPGGRYDWHCDTGPVRSGMDQRVISAVVQLLDPATYEGGQFEVARYASVDLNKVMYGQPPDDDIVESISAPRGSVTVFPSIVQHRVLPVSSGIRKSLVGWCDGRFI